MFRSFFNGLAKLPSAQRVVSRWGLAWKLASRFVAGDTVHQAVDAVRALNQNEINASVDQLGENTSSAADASQATAGILEVLDEVQRAVVCGNVSIKLTQIGLTLDERLCRDNLRLILERARGYGNFVRIDMEDATLTGRTIDLYQSMRAEGFDNVGIVIQAYLYRSEADIRTIAGTGGRIRLCKGAYKEPASVAFPEKRQVDENYDHLTELLLDAALAQGSPAISADKRTPPIPAIATHDPLRIAHAREYAGRIGLPKDAFEFQMLYGIRRDLQEQLAQAGYHVRVYVPFGTHWYPYLMRRMGERPANLWFIVGNLLRK